MRFLVVVVSAGAALALIAASGLMNWVFMTSLGKSAFEQQILGAVSLAVSAFLALFPTLLVWAFRERRTLYIILGVPVFLAFAAFSLSSAVGFAAKNRGSVSEDRALAAAKLSGIRRDIEQDETKLNALGALRPGASSRNPCVASNRIAAGSPQNPARRRRRMPLALFARAISISRPKRRGQARRGFWKLISRELKSEARRLEEQGAGREADNQAAVLARLLGLEAAKVERALMLFLALLVEIGAALGLFFATGHMRPETSGTRRGAGGSSSSKARSLKDTPEGKPARVPAKQIAATAPRRVQRLTQT